MLDIKFVRSNPEVVKQNIKNKFQDSKLPLVDEVLELDQKNREIKGEVEALRAEKNKTSKQIGAMMAQGKKEEAEELKRKVTESADKMEALSAEEKEVEEKIKKIMMTIPNIIDPSVPIGKDDSENVELERFGEPVVPDFEVPYHTEIMERFNGIDLDSARKVAGNGFYYLMGDIARLHSAVISYARDFMINRGFTYCIPPFMIRSNVGSRIDRSQFMLCRRHLIVLGLCCDAQFPALLIELFHELSDPLTDDSEIVVIHLLSFRRHCPEQCPSCKDQVFSLQIFFFVYKEVFLFRSHRGIDIFYILLSKQV